MVSTSFFDLERDRERDSERLSFDRFASFCPFDSLGKADAGIRYPPLLVLRSGAVGLLPLTWAMIPFLALAKLQEATTKWLHILLWIWFRFRL
jgi:hypothetical protein